MPEEETLFVEDTNCSSRYPERAHEFIVNGDERQIHTFKYLEKLEMPIGAAMRFTVDEAFRVTDHDGKRFDPAPKLVDRSLPIEVGDDECIAKFEELTQHALLARAVVEPGSDEFHRSTKKDELCAFLTARMVAKNAPADEDDPDAMTEEELAALDAQAA